jgi:tetratricopeptide (TPR) repeat protein
VTLFPIVVVLMLGQAPLPPDKLPPNHPAVPEVPLPADHPAVAPGANAPSGEELIKRLEAVGDLKSKEKTFEIAASLGKLYFAHARYADAALFFEQAVVKAEPARTLYLAKKKAVGSAAVPTAAAAGCPTGPDVTLEQQLKKAQSHKEPSSAAACARAALHPLIEVENQLAAAKFLNHDSEGALAVYERALTLFDSNPEARYGRAALLLDTKGDQLPALKSAKADLERFLADYPTSPRALQAKAFLKRIDAAIAAGGVSKVKVVAKEVPEDPHAAARQNGQPPMLTKEMIDAVQNVERTPEMAQGFSKLVEEGEEHLAKGRFQDALDNYKRVVPFEPENARAKAGMAWAMVKLNKQPMADNVWRVAAQAPEAIDALGDTLKTKGDSEQAKAVWQKLAQTVPAYANKLGGKL